MTIQIEEGKFYRTRDGRKIGPMERSLQYLDYPWKCSATGIEFTSTGRFVLHGYDPKDIVAEWADEPSWRNKPLLTRAEVADIFKRSTAWVDNQIARTWLISESAGRRVFITSDSVSSLLDYIASKADPVVAPAQAGGFIPSEVDLIGAAMAAHYGPKIGAQQQQQQKNEPGWKMDAGKPRLDLLAPEMLFGVSEILAFGAAKYGERNWEAGMSWGRCFGALMRHMWAWWRGEKADAETGKSHLLHAGCCLMFLIAYEERAVGTDDRPKISVDATSEV